MEIYLSFGLPGDLVVIMYVAKKAHWIFIQNIYWNSLLTISAVKNIASLTH